MKSIKISIALTVALALTAVTASAASALTFNSSSSPVALSGTSGTSTHIWKVDGQTTECTAEFSKSAMNSGSNAISNIEVTYSSCLVFGIPGSVNMGNCTYEFLTPNDAPAIMGKFAVRCNDPKNDFITLLSKLFGEECEVKIGETGNTSLSTLSYVNNTPKAGTFRVTAALTGMSANKTRDNTTCPLTGTGATNTVTYSGTIDTQGLLGASIAVS